MRLSAPNAVLQLGRERDFACQHAELAARFWMKGSNFATNAVQNMSSSHFAVNAGQNCERMLPFALHAEHPVSGAKPQIAYKTQCPINGLGR